MIATERAEKVIAKIRDLPPLSLAIQKLLYIVDHEQSSAKDVARVLSLDQALTAKVLALVNSAFYGFSREISIISRAVVILGNSAIRNLALSLAVYDSLKAAESPVNWDLFWDHSITVAHGAHLIATKLNYEEPEEAFIAGLLHDIGKFVLGTALPDDYSFVVETGHADIVEMEKEIIGISHTTAGIRLLENWNLPEQLCKVARLHHSPFVASMEQEPLLTIVMLADMLSCINGHGYLETADETSFFAVAEIANLPMQVFGSVMSETDKLVKGSANILGIDLDSPCLDREAGAEREMATIALVGTASKRTDLVQGILRHYGYNVLVVPSTSARAIASEATKLVIFADSLPEGDLDNLPSALLGITVPVVTLNSQDKANGDELQLLKQFPKLPTMFSQQDIDEHLNEERQ